MGPQLPARTCLQEQISIAASASPSSAASLLESVYRGGHIKASFESKTSAEQLPSDAACGNAGPPIWCCKTVVPCSCRTKQTKILSHASSQREALEGRVYEQEVALEHRFDELEAAVQVGGCYVAIPASSKLHGLTRQVLDAAVPRTCLLCV